MDIITGTLPPSKSHKRRDFVFTRHNGVSKLTIRQGKAAERYEVEEDPQDSGPNGRAWLLCKGDGEVYGVYVGREGRFCTCPGAKLGGHLCKHVETLGVLLERGDLDPAPEWPPVDEPDFAAAFGG